jgi:alpha-amylase
VRFSLRNARVETGQYVAVSGSTPELGSWDAAKAFVLGNGSQPVWTGDINVTGKDVEYKYLIVDAKGSPVVWEVCAFMQLDT